MSNAKREEKYQQFVRGWVNYFKLADMKGLLTRVDEWAGCRIRAVYLETMEKGKDTISYSQKTKAKTLASNKTSEQQMWVLENGRNAKYNTYKENNSQVGIYIHA